MAASAGIRAGSCRRIEGRLPLAEWRGSGSGWRRLAALGGTASLLTVAAVLAAPTANAQAVEVTVVEHARDEDIARLSVEVRNVDGLALTVYVSAEGPAEVLLERTSTTLLPGEAKTIAATVDTSALDPGEHEFIFSAIASGFSEVGAAEKRSTSTSLLVFSPAPNAAHPPVGDGDPMTIVVVGLVAAALGGAALAWVARRAWMAQPLVGLLARLERGSKAMHPTRAKILGAIRDSPGLSLAELQSRVGLANGVFAYHIGRLVDDHQIVLLADGRHRRVFISNADVPDLERPLRERLLALVEERGVVTSADAARVLGARRQAIHYHVWRLARAARIYTTRRGRDVELRAAVERMPANDDAAGKRNSTG